MPGLVKAYTQDDFSAGIVRSVTPARVPRDAVYDLQNGLLTEEGAIYRRGGWTALSAALASGKRWFLWEGQLAAGYVTLVGNSTGLYTLNTGTGVLTAVAGITSALSQAEKPVVHQGKLYFANGKVFDGATVTTATAALGFASVANRLLRVSTFSTIDFSVLQATGTGNTTAGSSSIAGVVTTSGQFQVGAQIVGDGIPLGTTIIAGPVLTLSQNATKTATGVPLTATMIDPRFDATDQHQIPDGSIIGIMGLRDSALVFTTRGMWVLSGLALNLTDAQGNVQHRLDRYSQDLVLWGSDASIAGWEGGLLVPGRDAVWLVSLGVASEAVQAFVRISDPIRDLYQQYVDSGYQPGIAAVYRNHYFLPIYENVAGEWLAIEVLVCKLDGHDSRGRRRFAWQRIRAGEPPSAVAVRPTSPASLMGVNQEAVQTLGFFDPADFPTDGGSPIQLQVVTGMRPTGDHTANTVVKVRASYELADDVSVPTLSAFVDSPKLPLNPNPTALVGSAPANLTTGKSYSWPVRVKDRALRFWVVTNSTSSRVALKALEMFVRPSGRM